RVTTSQNRRSHTERKGDRMKRGKYWIGGLAALGASIGIWAAVGTAATPTRHSEQKLTKITFQLKWVTQAQFAGYYAAAAKGFYKKAGRDVKISVDTPDPRMPPAA